MNQKVNHVAFPITFVAVMVSYLSVLFFANADTSFAASAKAKSSAVARTSAVDQTEARIKQLKDAIKITDAQEVLWNNVTQVMRENAKEMDVISKERADNTKTMNAVEHMKFHSKMTEAHLGQMKKLLPTFEALYASMSDEQKKSTDTIFLTGKHGKHKIQ